MKPRRVHLWAYRRMGLLLFFEKWPSGGIMLRALARERWHRLLNRWTRSQVRADGGAGLKPKDIEKLAGTNPLEPIEVHFMCPEEFEIYEELLDNELSETDDERAEQEHAVDKFLKDEGLL